MKMNDTVYDALKILIKISKNAQDDAQSREFYGSPLAWVKEYCTVRACTARRGGHTTAILKLMEDNQMHIGCVFNSYSMKEMFERNYNEQRKGEKRLEFCSNIGSLDRNSFAGNRFPALDALIIDNSFLYSKKEEEKIYELACHLAHPEFRIYGNTNKHFFLIFLQQFFQGNYSEMSNIYM